MSKIPRELGKLGLEIDELDPGGSIRLGGKVVPVEGHTSWRHFESPSKRPWIDIVEFPNRWVCRAVFNKSRQPHSGRNYPGYWSFVTITNDRGLDAVAVVIRRGDLLLNVGFAIPFRIVVPHLEGREPTLSERMHVSAAIDSMTLVLGALANALADSPAVARIP